MVLILCTVLVAFIILNVFTYFHKIKAEQIKTQSAKTEQVKVNGIVNSWASKETIIKNAVKAKNDLIVLEGNQQISKTYTTTDSEITYQGGDSVLKFMVGKLNEFHTRSLTINTTYLYDYTYDMNNVLISIDKDGLATISLSELDINLKPLSELSANRVITDEKGILASNFTPQELSGLMTSTNIHAYNTLVNDSSLFQKSIDSTKTNLTKLCNELGVTNIKFNVTNSTFLANTEVRKVN